MVECDLEPELKDAEALLKYAASVGIDVGHDVRSVVLASMSVPRIAWTQEEAEKLLIALTALSKTLKPVSGESLRQCMIDKVAEGTLRTFRRVAIWLGVIIMPFSIAAYVATTTCETIRTDIETANALAVTLGLQAWPTPAAPSPGETAKAPAPTQDELTKLQQLATLIRDIHSRTAYLTWFRLGPLHSAFSRYELPPPPFDTQAEISRAIPVYQVVRSEAQSVRENVSTTFGALTTGALPILYALLGACAYMIRLFEEQFKARTFTATDKPIARFLIAGIAGLVVGLFGGFGTGQGATVLPPLGIAFLAGYGVDVFFFFLDGILQTFRRRGEEAPAPVGQVNGHA